MGLLESSREGKEALLIGLDYLLNISFVADDEVFKISLDYWNFFVPEVYSSVQTALVEMNGGFGGFGGQPNGGADTSRKRFFAQVLSRLRLLMITRMAKPEEVRCSASYSLNFTYGLTLESSELRAKKTGDGKSMLDQDSIQELVLSFDLSVSFAAPVLISPLF